MPLETLRKLCTKENLLIAATAVAGIATAVLCSKSDVAPETPQSDFDRDVYQNPEFFRDVMEDLGIWEADDKL